MQIHDLMTRLVSPNQKIFVEAEVYPLGDKPPFGNAPQSRSFRSLFALSKTRRSPIAGI